MNFTERERIQRSLYKQEQKKLAEEKKKYPALYSQIKNIKDYFYLNDKEYFDEFKNIHLPPIPDVEYNIDSFMDSEERPDLYTPLGKISGDNYELTQFSEKNNNLNNKLNNNNDTNIKNKKDNIYNKTNPPKAPKEKFNKNNPNKNKFIPNNSNKLQNGNTTTTSNQIIKTEKNDKGDFQNGKDIEITPLKNHKLFNRYFDFDFDFPEIKLNSKNELILPKRRKIRSPFFKKFKRTVSKYNTSSINSLNFCYICLSLNHSLKTECPIYKRCYKCLKYGHWAKNCKEELKNKCENCGLSIHNKEDCLKNPKEIKSIDILVNKKDIKLKCAFCESRKHLLCPFSMRENFVINIENKMDKNQNGGTKDFSKILFCPFCAGNHLKTECKEKEKEKKLNEFYDQEKNKIINEKNIEEKNNKENKDNKENKENKDNKENEKNKGNNIIDKKNEFINRKRELNNKKDIIFKRQTSNFSWVNQSDNNSNNNNNTNKPFEINWSTHSNNNSYNNNYNKQNHYYKKDYYKKDYSKYKNKHQYNNNNYNNKSDYSNNNNYRNKTRTNDIYNKRQKNDNDNYRNNNEIINISNNNMLNIEEDNWNEAINSRNIYEPEKVYETYDYFAERRKAFKNKQAYNKFGKRFERNRSKFRYNKNYRDYRDKNKKYYH